MMTGGHVPTLASQVLQKSRIMSSNLLRYAVTERNILAYIRHPYIVAGCWDMPLIWRNIYLKGDSILDLSTEKMG